jgi:hypothetical protein
MNTELKPCPFCGGPAVLFGEAKFRTMIYCCERDAGGFHVGCSDCGTLLGYRGEQEDLDITFGKYGTEAEAIAAWNTRAPSDALKGAVRILELDGVEVEYIESGIFVGGEEDCFKAGVDERKSCVVFLKDQIDALLATLQPAKEGES